MSFLECSKREKDLLTTGDVAKTVLVKDDTFTHAPMAFKQNLEAPERKANFAPHELVAEGSRIAPSVASFIEGCRRVGGTAHAENLIMELNAASNINRGPAGVYQSSRLHMDVLLGRDESYGFGDYLGDDKY